MRFMNKSRGSGRPACEEAAADAGYASGTWRRAASLSGQAGAGGRTDAELLICMRWAFCTPAAPGSGAGNLKGTPGASLAGRPRRGCPGRQGGLTLRMRMPRPACAA